MQFMVIEHFRDQNPTPVRLRFQDKGLLTDHGNRRSSTSAQMGRGLG